MDYDDRERDWDKPWYKQKEDFCLEDAIGTLPEPYDWLTIGPCPYFEGMTLETARSIDLFLSVDDDIPYQLEEDLPRPDTRTMWVGIGEFSNWGYAPFLYTTKILDVAHERRIKTYLHCAGGIRRSVMTAYVWLLSRGHTHLEAASYIVGDRPELEVDHFNTLVEQGRIPNNIEDFMRAYRRMKEKGYTPGVDSILLKNPELGGIISGEGELVITKS